MFINSDAPNPVSVARFLRVATRAWNGNDGDHFAIHLEYYANSHFVLLFTNRRDIGWFPGRRSLPRTMSQCQRQVTLWLLLDFYTLRGTVTPKLYTKQMIVTVIVKAFGFRWQTFKTVLFFGKFMSDILSKLHITSCQLKRETISSYCDVCIRMKCSHN